MQTRRLSDLDALRGIAVAIVILAHIPGNLLAPARSWMPPFSSAFAVGVDIFFAISGFVIGRSLLPDLRRGMASGALWPAIRAFWLRRAKRLLPAAYLWLVIPCVLSLALGTSLFGTPQSVLQAAVAAMLDVFNALLAYRFLHQLYPGPLFHYWSLSLEEQFYFAVPAVILLPRRWLILALLCAIPLICATRGPYAGVFRFEELLSGLALAAFEDGGPRFSVLKKSFIRQRRFLPFVSLALLLGVMQLDMGTLGAAFAPRWHLWLARLGISAGSTLLVFLAARDCGGLVGRGVVYRLLLGIGRRSYSIYLVHISAFFGTQEIMARLGIPEIAGGYTDALTLLIGLGLVTAFSEATYRLVERRAWRAHAFPAFSKVLLPGNIIAVSEPSEEKL